MINANTKCPCMHTTNKTNTYSLLFFAWTILTHHGSLYRLLSHFWLTDCDSWAASASCQLHQFIIVCISSYSVHYTVMWIDQNLLHFNPRQNWLINSVTLTICTQTSTTVYSQVFILQIELEQCGMNKHVLGKVSIKRVWTILLLGI